MGHLTLISEDVINALAHFPRELRLELVKYEPQPEWDDYVGGRYRETKTKDTCLLGGGKPSVTVGGLIRGAGKWKVESILRDEGFNLPPGNGVPSVYRHSATDQAKAWAESTDMDSLVAAWSKRNNGRWIITIVVALLSGYATLYL